MKTRFIQLLLLLFIFLPSLSPAGGRVSPVKCETGLAHLKSNGEIASRPDLPLELISPGGRFKIHYTLDGEDSTSLSFVDSAAVILDAAWSFQIDSLGFAEPPSEEDGFIHLYFQDMNYAYGRTEPIASGANVPSFMVVENDFSEDVFATKGLDALKVTLAHEFHHVVQFGYYRDFSQMAFYEMCAVWMEEKSYDDVNDYINYLSALMDAPNVSIINRDYSHEYAAGVFIMLVDDEYGSDAIVDTWERLEARRGHIDLFSELISQLEERGTEQTEIASKWMSWLLFTGDRAVDGFGFPDAALFDTLQTVEPIPYEGESISQSLGRWGFTAKSIPTGIDGNPGFSTDSNYPSIAQINIDTPFGALVKLENEITEFTCLRGNPAFISVLNLHESVQEITLDAVPDLAVPPESIVPSAITLSPSYPNPANGTVYWNVSVNQSGWVSFEIFDLLGRKINGFETFVRSNRTLPLSWEAVTFQGRTVSSGVYFIRGTVKGMSTVRPIAIVN